VDPYEEIVDHVSFGSHMAYTHHRLLSGLRMLGHFQESIPNCNLSLYDAEEST